MLTSQEIVQYQRHLSLSEIGKNGQEKLKSSSVLIVGAGGLGCAALQYLAAAGVGRIGIVDYDQVEASNLQRQILYCYEDIGKSKAKVSAERLNALNPFIQIIPYNFRLHSKNIKSIFNDYDLIIDGTDNFASRYLINDACVLLGKALVYGAIYKFEGQVSVFNYKKGPTYRCLYPSPPRSNVLPNCSQIGVLGVLPGIIGNFQALEAMKILLNIGEPLSGKVLLYNALEQRVRILKLNSEEENKMISDLNEISMITSCDGEKQNIFIKEIQPSEFSEMVSSGVELIIIDVREEWEREISKISPSVHIPLGEFSTSQIPSIFHKYSPESKIVVYCKAGIRSRTACEVLQEYSFTNLHNLSGGIDQWEKEGFEVN